MILDLITQYLSGVVHFWTSLASTGVLKMLLIWAILYWIFSGRRHRRWRRRHGCHSWKWSGGCGHAGRWGRRYRCTCRCTCGGCRCRRDHEPHTHQADCGHEEDEHELEHDDEGWHAEGGDDESWEDEGGDDEEDWDGDAADDESAEEDDDDA